MFAASSWAVLARELAAVRRSIKVIETRERMREPVTHKNEQFGVLIHVCGVQIAHFGKKQSRDFFLIDETAASLSA